MVFLEDLSFGFGFLFVMSLVALIVGSIALSWVMNASPKVRAFATMSQSSTTASTSSATSLLTGPKSGSFTIPANSCQEGTVLRLRCVMHNTATTVFGTSLDFALKANSTTLCGLLTNPADAITDGLTFIYEGQMTLGTNQQVFATNSLIYGGYIVANSNNLASFDKTIANVLDLTVGVIASGGTTIVVDSATLEKLN